MEFELGDHVVYPAYGAGTVAAKEERVFSGTTTRYYILKMVADEGEFMVPVEQAEMLGIRPVMREKAILKVLRSAPNPLPDDYKERQAIIEELLATSDAIKLALGARDLAWFSGVKSLTGRDMQLYEDLQTQLASELSLAKGIGLEEAREGLVSELNGLAAKAEARAEAEALAQAQAEATEEEAA
jgi:CarD family transcriptional regulator